MLERRAVYNRALDERERALDAYLGAHEENYRQLWDAYQEWVRVTGALRADYLTELVRLERSSRGVEGRDGEEVDA